MRTNVINFIRYGEFLNIGTLITDCGQNKSLLITHIPDDCRNGFSFEADTLTIRNRNVIGQSIEDPRRIYFCNHFHIPRSKTNKNRLRHYSRKFTINLKLIFQMMLYLKNESFFWEVFIYDSCLCVGGFNIHFCERKNMFWKHGLFLN